MTNVCFPNGMVWERAVRAASNDSYRGNCQIVEDEPGISIRRI